MRIKLGVVNYDKEGKPICNICGESFNKLLSHVVQKHNVSADDYKKIFGYDKHKAIISEKSRGLASKRAKDNFEKILPNLLEKGKKTRFKKGHKGRPANKVSPQTARRLKNNTFKTKKK